MLLQTQVIVIVHLSTCVFFNWFVHRFWCASICCCH